MSKFNLNASLTAMAEAIVTMKGAESARTLFNNELKECQKAKIKWQEMRDGLAGLLEKRGLEGGTLRVTLSTVKWCFEEGVELETFTKSVMTDRANKGLVKDLLTGKPKTVKAKTKKTDKGTKAKTEATVEHCGIGMAKAMTQQGFIKFLNVLVYDLTQVIEAEVNFGIWMDDDKLDLVRNALAECGYMAQDGAEWKVTIIKESEDEASE